jgi:heme exporter protein A
MIKGLVIRSLALGRGDRVLLEGFDLDVGAGEAVVLTGPNGAGKTSLLRAVAGLIRPLAGGITIEAGADEIPLEDAIAREAHLIGHQDGLKTARLAWDEVLFQVLWTGGSANSARAACARMGLDSLLGMQVRKLSAGQRRRLALVRLIASPRDLWLLDEPLAPLDRVQRARFGDLLTQHLARGGLVLAAAHDPLPVKARTIEIAA